MQTNSRSKLIAKEIALFSLVIGWFIAFFLFHQVLGVCGLDDLDGIWQAVDIWGNTINGVKDFQGYGFFPCDSIYPLLLVGPVLAFFLLRPFYKIASWTIGQLKTEITANKRRLLAFALSLCWLMAVLVILNLVAENDKL